MDGRQRLDYGAASATLGLRSRDDQWKINHPHARFSTTTPASSPATNTIVGAAGSVVRLGQIAIADSTQPENVDNQLVVGKPVTTN